MDGELEYIYEGCLFLAAGMIQQAINDLNNLGRTLPAFRFLIGQDGHWWRQRAGLSQDTYLRMLARGPSKLPRLRTRRKADEPAKSN